MVDLSETRSPATITDASCSAIVLENMAATLGVGGLSPIKLGLHSRALTSGARPGRCFQGTPTGIGSPTYDRYHFISHAPLEGVELLRRHLQRHIFELDRLITANQNGPFNKVDAEGVYAATDEGGRFIGGRDPCMTRG